MAISPCNIKVNEQGRELLEHGTALLPAACYHDDLSVAEVPWHWHEEFEAVLVSEGTALMTAGEERYIVSAGGGLFVNGNVLHAAWQQGAAACRFHSIVFHPRLVGGSAESVFWQKYLQPLLSDASFGGMVLAPNVSWQGQALDAIEQAWQGCRAEAPGYEFVMRDALSRLVFLAGSHRAPAPQPVPQKVLRDAERIKRMLQYIQAHYAEALTVTDIARAAAISTSECLRCFRATLGCSPMQYLRQYRVQAAAGLLLETEAAIAEIGALCGFEEMSYFAKTFRQLRGCTPTAYRRRGRSAE